MLVAWETDKIAGLWFAGGGGGGGGVSSQADTMDFKTNIVRVKEMSVLSAQNITRYHNNIA